MTPAARRFDDPASASARLFERASRVIPGGTSKANLHVRPHPFYLAEGQGCRVTDVDGVERLDAINSFTALVHGHAFPPIVDAVTRRLARGHLLASTPDGCASRAARRAVPGSSGSAWNSGTEAVMMAIKAARSTGRDASPSSRCVSRLLRRRPGGSSRPDNWGPDDSPASLPSSGGIPKHRVLETLVLPWNDVTPCEALARHRTSWRGCWWTPCRTAWDSSARERLPRVPRQVTRAHGSS
jgi:glutamate-1-semialdehyde 2,1-aminomutase